MRHAKVVEEAEGRTKAEEQNAHLAEETAEVTENVRASETVQIAEVVDIKETAVQAIVTEVMKVIQPNVNHLVTVKKVFLKVVEMKRQKVGREEVISLVKNAREKKSRE